MRPAEPFHRGGLAGLSQTNKERLKRAMADKHRGMCKTVSSELGLRARGCTFEATKYN